VSFASLLDHQVHLVRRRETSEDDYNQAEVVDEIGEDFAAAIQPKSVRDVALISQAGAAIGLYTIYCQPRIVRTQDALVHDTARCSKPDERDFPTQRFEVTGVRQQTGRGHHLAIDARLVNAGAGVEGS
jgi:hypothetical protein